MTNREWLDLFFCESFEKQINNLILDDWDYEAPRNSMINYANHLLSIPYKEYIDYTEPDIYIDDYDLPKISIDKKEVSAILEYFQQEDNRGLSASEVGHHISQKCQKNYSNVNVYGAKILGAAQIMGLVYNYFGRWYLNCIAYIFEELSEEESQSIISRMILRNKGIGSIVHRLQTGSHSFFSFFYRTSFNGISRYVRGVCSILSICRKEGEKEGLICRYLKDDPILFPVTNGIDRGNHLYKNIVRNISNFEGLNDVDLFDRDLNIILSMNGFVKAVLRDLNELETDRCELRELCPLPNLREGEAIKKQLIVSSDSIRVTYATYNSSWRDDEFLANYNPAVNEEFLRKLLPHQQFRKDSVKKQNHVEKGTAAIRSRNTLPITDLDAVSADLVKVVTANELQRSANDNNKKEETDLLIIKNEKDNLCINDKFYDFSDFQSQRKDQTEQNHEKDNGGKASIKTPLPFYCNSYSCVYDNGKICIKLKSSKNESVICKTDFHSDIGQLFHDTTVVKVSSYKSKKGNRIEVHYIVDEITKIRVFNDIGQKIWDR